MDRGRTSSYRPLRRRGRWRWRWHLLGRHVRLRPAWPWWAMWLGGTTAVTALLDVVGLMPWWVGPPLGLLLGLAVLALTAFDDVRRPVASLRVLAAELREGHPSRAPDAIRARVFDIPLYAPPPEAGQRIQLTGGGASYGPRLLSPARRRLQVSWSGATSVRATATWATTIVDPDGTRSRGHWLHDGLLRTWPPDEDRTDPSQVWVDEGVVREQDASLTVVLDGEVRAADAADLQPWGGGWAATLRLDDRHRLDLCGRGALPDQMELVRWDPADLVPDPPAQRGRERS